MARTWKIRCGDGRVVPGRFAAADGATGILLAHGAGAGQDHPFMTQLRDGLAAEGFPTLTFDYPYVAEGRRRPDRPDTLLACHRAAADRLAARVARVVLAGKSMGGRMASHLAGDHGWPAAALVYYGYPLVAMGKTEPRPVDHLMRIAVPQLFFVGTRDRLCPIDVLEPVVASLPDAQMVVVPDGDHSFKVPKRAGRTHEEVIADLATTTARWLRDRGLG